ncbi:MAG TPA: MFS transporter [Acidimicrobiales bacterium]|nr:MFS transporter [Acidimicrobiales bacterium]
MTSAAPATDVSAKPARDWGRYGRRPLVILALVGLIDAIDRGILPGAASKIQDELHFSDTKIGVLSTAFIFASFLATPVAGYIVDRRRRTRVIATVLAGWGVLAGLTAAVQNFVQFLGVRAVLGGSDAVNGPAGQSLIADYYPPAIRGRAYAVRQVTPVLGTAIGTGVGGVVAGTIGWRWAFLLVGIPGSLLALTVLRLAEPRRGEHDGDPPPDASAETAIAEAASNLPVRPPSGPDPVPQSAGQAIRTDLRAVIGIPTLRALMIGSGVITGSLTALGYWAPSFYERHAGLSTAQSGAVSGGLILFGAIAGTIAGGVIADRLRTRYEGAPMLLAGIAQFVGGVLLFVSFLPVPTWTVRVPLQFIGVLFIVGAIPALAVMTAEVAPARLRGTAFAVTTWLGALLGGVTAPLVGALAVHWPIVVHGKKEGNLALAFAIVTPLVLLGSMVVLNGRRHVAADTARARAAAVTG